jgi:hypothetical protein
MDTFRRFGIGSVVVLTLLGVSARADAATFTFNYTSLASQVFGLLPPDDMTFVLTNNTGVTWTDFHLTSNGAGGFLVDTYSGPGTATYGGGSGTILGNQFFFALDIVGLNVTNGSTLTFTQDFFCFGEICGLGATGTATPTTTFQPPDGGGGTSVPEPSSILLLASGLGAVVAARKRR